ncbi:MAG: DapH/DapD/GlmU-related protein [Leptothrix sp. (in: b-proteobacteria)]
MNELFFKLIEKIASIIRKNSYTLDRKIPLSYLVKISLDKIKCLLRAVLHGYSIKRKIFIGKNVSLLSKNKLFIQSGTVIGDCVYIDALSHNGIQIGCNVSVGPYSRIEASGTISNIGAGIKIGNNTGIGSYCFIGGAGGVSIGSDVIMGQWVSFHPENHNHENIDIPIRLQGVIRKGITIEDDCWIGVKVTFLDGAHVGRGCVIAAGAIVKGFIPPFSVAAGIPARVIRSRKTSTLA